MKTDMWHTLDGRGADAAHVGSKAASLDRLAATSVAVPQAAVLCVDAYETFVEGAGLAERLGRLPAAVEPRDLAADAERVDRAFLEAPLPSTVRDAMARAYEHVARGGAVAVRSSATAEDLSTASFAGQYRSFLSVDDSGLERAVRLCWASLWSPGARAYREALGVDTAGLAMAVVIQRMVWADWSGVAFTSDPAALGGGLVRVEVIEGLGERLVSGSTTPRVFRAHRAGGKVIEPDAPAFVAEVARMALAIEADVGHPQDVEWSVADGELYALQARPITTTAGLADDFDTPAGTTSTFIPAGVAEMLPGVLPPLVWTINRPLLEDAFTTLMKRLGLGDPSGEEPWVARFRGRAALNLSRVKAAARRMPGGSDAEIERQYLGRELAGNDLQTPRRANRLRRLRPGVRAVRLRRSLRDEAETFLEAVHLLRDLQIDYGAVASEALVAYRHRVRDLARFGIRTEVAVAAAAATSYRALELTLARWMDPKEAGALTQRLTAGGVGAAAGGCAALLLAWDLQCESCQLPEVTAALSSGSSEGIDERLSATAAGREFLTMVENALRRRGCTAVYGGPTWDEDRQAFWSALRHCVALTPPESPRSRMEAVTMDSRQLLANVTARLCRTWRWRLTRALTGQVVDVRKRLLGRVVEDATDFLRLREAVKAALLAVGGEERRVARELARRLASRGLLPVESDVWLLADDELERLALTGGGPTSSVLVHRRAALEAAHAAPPLPELFSGAPPAAEIEGPSEKTAVLAGWAASPGRSMGPARVVRDAADAVHLQAGEVLVGRSSDPSWTPLFLRAAALVMEEGGPLSHAAIVARELRLPAVLNVRGATRRIRTGMLVSVDGSAGTVDVLERASGQVAA